MTLIRVTHSDLYDQRKNRIRYKIERGCTKLYAEQQARNVSGVFVIEGNDVTDEMIHELITGLYPAAKRA